MENNSKTFKTPSEAQIAGRQQRNTPAPAPELVLAPGSALDLNANGIEDVKEFTEGTLNNMKLDRDRDHVPDGAEATYKPMTPFDNINSLRPTPWDQK